MQPAALDKIVIVGGGSAGWMMAAALANSVRGNCTIELVESAAIGVIGVGEATIPPIKLFNQGLGIDENEFLKATQGSFKLGIQFVNWTRLGHSYFHPFGQYGADFDTVSLHHYWLRDRARGDTRLVDEYSLAWKAAEAGKFDQPIPDPRRVQSTYDYAYHFDAVMYAGFLARFAQARGVTRTEGMVTSVERSGETGNVTAIVLSDGRKVEGDFFIDCTGFRGLLIEGEMQTGYEDWTHWLPVNRAVAVPCESGGEFTPYTRSTAREAGWQWRIPLQHRTGNGHVFCDQYISDDEATSVLMDNLDGKPLGDPRIIPFKAGHRNKFWNKNVLALGLAAGFLEPLESTAIHLVQSGINRFLALFPDKSGNPLNEQEYNRITTTEYERVRDFIILHYKATYRDDAELWRYVSAMDIPDDLAYRMAQFRETGRIVSPGIELFQNPSWLAVMAGQEVMGGNYDPLVDQHPHVDSQRIMTGLRRTMDEVVAAMPTHGEYIARHCAAPKVSV